MSEQNKSDGQSSQLPVIAIVALLAGLIWVNEPYKTTRPSMSESEKGSSENVRSRLWQDPFAAVERHRHEHHPDDQKTVTKKEISNKNPNVAYHLDQEPQRMCNTSTLSSRTPPDGTPVKWPPNKTLKDVHSIEDLRCQVQRDTELCELILRPVNHDSKQDLILNEFKSKFKTNNKKCTVLATATITSGRAQNFSNWTIAELNDDGIFNKILVKNEDLNNLLSIEARKKLSSVNRNNIIKKARKELGHTNIADLQVLAVMVPSGPYAEDRERRLRSRYAVISALAESGYVPEDPEHIGYIEFSNKCKDAIREEIPDSTHFCDWPAFIPYEWFGPTESNKVSARAPSRVLVLWLGNEPFAFSRPLEMLGELNHLLKPIEGDDKFGKERYATVNFHVLGPSDSTTLQKMYAEISSPKVNVKEKNYSYLKDSLIFSSQAAKNPKTIIENLQSSPENPNIAWLNNKIIRTTNTNDELAKTLVCELALRGVQPFGKISKKKEKRIRKHCKEAVFEPKWLPRDYQNHHIALISEFDTLYSRDIIDSIRKTIININFGKDKVDVERDWAHRKIHNFNYLRGLDGVNADNETDSIGDKKTTSNNTDKEQKERKEAQIRRPVGPNQFDYLRRIADRINQLDKKLKKDNGSIRAIGILGSDTYDKLLILQALRDRFPGVLFFTTDLDARLLHPEESDWTRNLIVASSYGLALEDKSQTSSAPPFRDSYQTGLYFSTIQAIGCWQDKCKDPKNVKHQSTTFDNTPKLFEVGNNGAVNLSNPRDLGDETRPERKHFNVNRTPERQFLVFFALLFSTFLVYQASPNTRRVILNTFNKGYIFYLVIMLCIISAVFIYFSMDWFYEPFSLTNGTSVWPAVFIMFVAAMAAVFFILRSLTKLKKHNNEVMTKLWPGGNSNFNSTKNKKEEEPYLGWQRIFIDSWERQLNENLKISFEHLWLRYQELSSFEYWCPRVVLILLLYALCILILFLTPYVDLPNIPYRGEASFLFSYLFSAIAIVSYLFLIFLVWDIAQLNSYFIQLLSQTEEAIDWPKGYVDTYCLDHRFPERIAEEKVLLDFIVKRADVVGKLVFYPFFVLFLMILSQSYYFDNWYIPLELGIIIGLTAIFALNSAIKLSHTVKNIRKEMLDRLEFEHWKSLAQEARYAEKLLQIKDKNSNNDKTLDSKTNKEELDPTTKELPVRIRLLINEIKEIKTGPFAPLTHHPIVHSILIPFGGVLGLYLIEYLASTAG